MITSERATAYQSTVATATPLVPVTIAPGDGIGPEVTAEGVRALEAIGKKYGHTFAFSEDYVGGAAIDAYGTALRPETLEAAKASDAVLWGAVGIRRRVDHDRTPLNPFHLANKCKL